MNHREFFFRHIAQTSPEPMLGNPLHIVRAEKEFLWDAEGKKYVDLISGIAVSSVGHCHPKVVEAVKEHASRFMHLMVYGEMIQSPQNLLAEALMKVLPPSLNNFYYTTGGSEAIEVALKIARKFTGRKKILAFKNSYHGSTWAALSLSSLEHHLNAFAPLLPGIIRTEFGSMDAIGLVDEDVACVVTEPIQAESGVNIPSKEFMEALRNRCEEKGVLLIFDEIQTGFGRTGKMFAFEHFGVVPDILCLAKAMGGGVPVGVCISSGEIMASLCKNPILGHMNTFGGNALACTAAKATLEAILQEKLHERAKEIQKIIQAVFESQLKDTCFKWRVIGAFGALELKDEAHAFELCRQALMEGIITDWFLFNSKSIRIAPPLNIDFNVLKDALEKLCNLSVKLSNK
ncbi:MAG: aspartate aminotransferase family protein [Bacteroidia bacterium]|nr:aspartate aminotransferase family protein [Bacteroidia bacterium]